MKKKKNLPETPGEIASYFTAQQMAAWKKEAEGETKNIPLCHVETPSPHRVVFALPPFHPVECEPSSERNNMSALRERGRADPRLARLLAPP